MEDRNHKPKQLRLFRTAYVSCSSGTCSMHAGRWVRVRTYNSSVVFKACEGSTMHDPTSITASPVASYCWKRKSLAAGVFKHYWLIACTSMIDCNPVYPVNCKQACSAGGAEGDRYSKKRPFCVKAQFLMLLPPLSTGYQLQ